MLDSLKIALCGETDEKQNPVDEKTITMSGPLSEVFTHALQIIYAKPPEVVDNGEAALESQANDAIMAMSAFNKTKGYDMTAPGGQQGGKIIKGNFAENMTVFAIPMSQAKSDIIPTAVTELANAGCNLGMQRNYLVVDDEMYNQANSTSPTFTKHVPVEFDQEAPIGKYTALESQCSAFGLELVVGFENFLKILRKNQR